MFIFCRSLIFVLLSTSSVFASLAPFSANDVITHAPLEKKESLRSAEGQNAIKKIIMAINNNQWPDRYNFKNSYNKTNPKDDHNKSLIADYVFRDLQKDALGQQVVKKLQEKGRVGADATMKSVSIKGSSYTDHVIFIKDKNSCPLIAKVFKTLEEFVAENKQLKQEDAYIGMVNELRRSCEHPLPLITRRVDKINLDGVGIIVLEKAKGNTLASIYAALPSMDDSKIKEIYHAVGAQFGALDNLMYTNKHEILFHPDAHDGNLLYDEKTRQLYWIDTAGLEFKDKKSSLPELKLFSYILNNASQRRLIKSKLTKALETFQDEIEKKSTSQLDVQKNILKLRLSGIERDAAALKVLASLSESEKKVLIDLIKPVIVEFKKQLLALKSFGEGYCEKNPSATYTYNVYVERKENVMERGKTLYFYLTILNGFEEALGLPQTSFDFEIK